MGTYCRRANNTRVRVALSYKEMEATLTVIESFYKAYPFAYNVCDMEELAHVREKFRKVLYGTGNGKELH